MAHVLAAPEAPPIHADETRTKDLLRFITCGSVDDGKSTLIGRLLYESNMLFDDQLTQLEADSKKIGTQGGELDFALLVDGLSAEREQGITIDVAYRFFATARRKFIVADTPGHEQYTRNMITGASTADLAVILIDARKGVLTQTRRHSHLVALIGIKRVVLAINKMDLVDYDRAVFERIDADYRAFAAELGFAEIVSIPMSALRGDNVIAPSARMPWYAGPPLMQHLDRLPLAARVTHDEPFRLPVQWVNRPHLNFRGYAGSIASGEIRVGERVRVLPSGRESRVASVITPAGEAGIARAGEAVTLTLADEIDISRGDLIARADAPPEVADQFEATLVWMHDEPLLPGRPYLVKLGTQTVGATCATPKYKIDVNTREHLAARTLALNEIGVCNLSFDRPVAFDPYDRNRHTGGFIVIDRFSNDTVGAGMLHFALRRAHNVHWQAVDVDRDARAAEGADAAHRVADGAVGRRQVDDREPRRATAARARQAYVPARRRQRAARPQPRSRLHRGRPRGEHPARRRSRAADARRGAHHARVVHLAVPRRARHGARAGGPGRIRRSVRRHAARGRGGARSEGLVQEGAARRAEALHRHRFAIRAARAAGVACRHGDRVAGGRGGSHRRVPAARTRGVSGARLPASPTPFG